MADLAINAGLDRLVVWAPHDKRVQGFYDKMPISTLNPIQFFSDIFSEFKGAEDVIGVAPDKGAVTFLIPFCQGMNIRSGIASKLRPEPEQATITEIIGDFKGINRAIVLDDMINTGGTIDACVKALHDEKGIQAIWLGVSHFLGSPQAIHRLQTLHEDYGLEKVIVTDSVPLTHAFLGLPYTQVRSIAGLLANAVARIHNNESIGHIIT